MDLVLVAQIITGLATLIVALVLVFQLKKQNQQLSIQHKDSVSNSINQFRQRFEDITKETVTNKEFAEIWVRGSLNWNNLKSDDERYRFRNHYRQYMGWFQDQLKLRDEGVLKITDEQIKHQARHMLALRSKINKNIWFLETRPLDRKIW